jgi:hypothetical protein
MRSHVRLTALVLVAGCLMGACGSDTDAEGSSTNPGATSADTETTAPAAPAAPAAPTAPTAPDAVTTTADPAATTVAVQATEVPPTQVAATEVPATPAPTAPPLPPVPAVPRVLLVGDSTLLAVEDYGVLDVLRGMDPVYEAKSCRALGQPSCGDDPPTNAVQVIDGVEGVVDIVVIMAGYDEWYTTFDSSFDQVVASARAKGAKRIVWLNYPEGVSYLLPDDTPANESLVNMNRIMVDKVASGAYPDVVIAGWYQYSSATEGWYSRDDIHLSRTGAYGVADYIARKVAWIAGQPCPAPREPGGAVEAPCPDPDVVGPVPDVVALHPPG